MNPWLDLYAPVIAIAAGVAALLALIWSFTLSRRLRTLEQSYDSLVQGTEGGNLEQVLNAHLDNVRAAVERSSNAWETATRVERAGRGHVQHVAVVRYNPFDRTGGDQSFVLAMIDEDGNGAVVNSLHARDGTRIYAKPLVDWDSTYMLTDEERDAIARARG
ncbi:MAG: DUF4446 family protein [Chloroflexota bacterium]|nr:DUF4446 family protein [Chloroflexota bacterium]